MISYERIDRSEGIDFNKEENSVKYMICNYYYFEDRDLNINHTFVMDVITLV